MSVNIQFHETNLGCFVLRRCASTINLLSHFAKQSEYAKFIIRKNNLGVQVNSEAYLCSIFRNFEEFGCLTLGMMC